MKFDAIKAVVAAIIFPIALTQPVWGQQAVVPERNNSYKALVEHYFGYDQNLVNGVQYYNRYLGSKGIPYFMNIGFVDGDLIIQERVYKNLRMRYDLLAQILEIEYDNNNGGIGWLVTVPDHITAFRFGEYPFRKLNLEGPSGKFYQVIKTDLFTCYIHWEKMLLPLQFEHQYTHKFSQVNSTTLLEVNGETNVFKNRKGFVKLFPENRQKVIKRFLRRNHFIFQNASPNEMVLSMNAVANLLNSGGLP